MRRYKESLTEFPLWLYPWGCRFDLWSPSVGEGSRVAMSCDVVVISVWNLALLWLWLWCRLTDAVLIWSLAWELPYATGMALKWKRIGSVINRLYFSLFIVFFFFQERPINFIVTVASVGFQISHYSLTSKEATNCHISV